MLRTIIAFFLLVFALSCQDDAESLMVVADIKIDKSTPNSVVLTVNGLDSGLKSIELVNTETQEVYVPIKFPVSGHNSFVIGLPKASGLISVDVKINGEVVGHEQFELPILPEEYSGFVDVEIDGRPDLGGNYLLVNKMSQPSGVFLFDANGELVWSRLSDNFVKMVKLTSRGTLLTLEDGLNDKFGNGNLIYETTFAGDTLVKLEYGQNGFDRMAHHDVVLTERGTYAFITNVHVDGLIVDGITELSAYGNKVWEWDMASHVLPIKPGTEFSQPWGNSIEEDENGNYLLSFRNLCQIWKVDALSGEVIMKFGRGEGMGLSDKDLPLYQHHAQELGLGNYLLYDNGDIEKRSHSRLIKYHIDNENQLASVEHVVELPSSLFSPFMSSVEQYNDGYISTSSIAKKVAFINKDGQVKWTMQFGDRMFRAQLVNVSNVN